VGVSPRSCATRDREPRRGDRDDGTSPADAATTPFHESDPEVSPMNALVGTCVFSLIACVGRGRIGIRLTGHPSADFSPQRSPQERTHPTTLQPRGFVGFVSQLHHPNSAVSASSAVQFRNPPPNLSPIRTSATTHDSTPWPDPMTPLDRATSPVAKRSQLRLQPRGGRPERSHRTIGGCDLPLSPVPPPAAPVRAMHGCRSCLSSRSRFPDNPVSNSGRHRSPRLARGSA
jgi:hypothetical protein